IILDYSDQQGTILMDRTLFQEYWHDDTVNIFRVYLQPGAQVPDVKRRILERFAGERQVFVLTNGELKRYILKITDQWFGLTLGLVTTILGAAFVAAVWPAESAVRGSLVEALEYE